MKILHVIPYFTPYLGGDVSVARALSSHLVKNGHRCDIVTTDYMFDQEYAQSLMAEGISIFSFHCIINFAMFIYSPGLETWAKHNVQQYDIIHLHDLRSYQNIVIARYAIKHNVPYIVQPHASTPRIMGKRFLKWLYDLMFGYRLMKNASHIIAVSAEELTYDKQYAPNTTMSLVYNGMNIENFREKHTGSFKQRLGIQDKLVLYLGRLNKTKGIDIALRAFAQIADDKCKFVIAGYNTAYKKSLQNLIDTLKIQTRVIFTGGLSEKEKIEALSDADVFIHTVRYMGGVGIAPLEAILCDTPVIVSKECGEIIIAADCGYVVDIDDIDDITLKLKQTLENPDISFIKRGQQYIEANLTWEKVTEKIEMIYTGVIPSR